jgi:hypothetical protein
MNGAGSAAVGPTPEGGAETVGDGTSKSYPAPKIPQVFSASGKPYDPNGNKPSEEDMDRLTDCDKFPIR